jgi:dihydroflavonol-4-reductase
MYANSEIPSSSFWAGKLVCVTGGTGFLGYHLVQELLAVGARVRVLALRPAGAHPLLDDPRIACAFGDVRDAAVVGPALAGCNVVFHTAATVAVWGPALERMHSIHIDGTRQVLAAADPPARVVHTSSLVAVGASHDGVPLTEDSCFDLENLRLDYVESKRDSERLALDAAARGQDVVVTNPGYLVGPDDFEKSVMGRLCRRFWKGRLLIAPPGGVNLVDVRDVARGHLLAAERGQSGRRYLLGGEDRTFSEFFRDLAEVAGLRPRAIPRSPAWALQGLAGLAECHSWLTKREPYPSFQHVRLNRLHWYCSSERAERELGYRARPLVDCLADTFRWYAAQDGLELNHVNRWWMRPQPQRLPSVA